MFKKKVFVLVCLFVAGFYSNRVWTGTSRKSFEDLIWTWIYA